MILVTMIPLFENEFFCVLWKMAEDARLLMNQISVRKVSFANVGADLKCPDLECPFLMSKQKLSRLPVESESAEIPIDVIVETAIWTRIIGSNPPLPPPHTSCLSHSTGTSP